MLIANLIILLANTKTSRESIIFIKGNANNADF